MTLKDKFKTELILIKDEVTEKLTDLLENGTKFGTPIHLPEQTDAGWQTSSDGPVRIYYNWLAIIEDIFGRNLELLKAKNSLLGLFKIFFENPNSSPRRHSTGDDYTHELKIFLTELLKKSKIKNSAIFFEDFNLIIDKAFEFFTKNEDQYLAEIPFTGLEIDQPIHFNF